MTSDLTRRALLATVAATATLPAAALAGITVTTASDDQVTALVAEYHRHYAAATELVRHQCDLEDALPASLTRGIQIGKHLGFDLFDSALGIKNTWTQRPLFANDADALRRHYGNDDAEYQRLLPELRAWEAARDADPRWQEFIAAENAADGVWDTSIAQVKRIADTPAPTMAGAHEKARLVEWLIAEGWNDFNAPLVRSLVADLDRLADRGLA